MLGLKKNIRQHIYTNKSKYVLYAVLFFFAIYLVIFSVYIYEKQQWERSFVNKYIHDNNFRDVGKSLNACLKYPVFNTGVWFRANRYFSGKDCSQIHNPGSIYSLNFDPMDPHEYYCNRSDTQKITGVFYNTDWTIHDIEDPAQWADPLFQKTMCLYINHVLSDMVNKQKILVHCTDGRDRTGAFVGLLALALGESAGIPNSTLISAIECDYEKTNGLSYSKKGHMFAMLENIKSQYPSILGFLKSQDCIRMDLLNKASNLWVINSKMFR
jgi:Tyrosine phosphatase family